MYNRISKTERYQQLRRDFVLTSRAGAFNPFNELSLSQPLPELERALNTSVEAIRAPTTKERDLTTSNAIYWLLVGAHND